ncbi:MAG: RNA polymerase sigma factor [Lachnospira sp.]|nr:RNA polymerase sigma factor [Lachnospira sp.]
MIEIPKIKGGIEKDNMEFNEVVKKYGDMIYKLAFVYMKNEYDADDVYQEVFIRYLKYKPEFENYEHGKSWFIVVTINVCKSAKTSSWSRHNVSAEGSRIEQMLDQSSKQKMTRNEENIIEALMALTDEARLIVQLYYYEEYTVKEIAAMMELKENTVYARLSRARKMMKKYLAKL